MANSPKIFAGDPVRKAVVYARVSSKEQEKEGFSIPAQLKLLKDYATAQGFAVTKEYVDVETAKQIGRTALGEMIALSRRNDPSAFYWWRRPTGFIET
jgi:site-specific DNA recombinase